MGDFTFTGPGNPCFASTDSQDDVIDQFRARMWKGDSICGVSRPFLFPLLKFLQKFLAVIDLTSAGQKIDNLANRVGLTLGAKLQSDLLGFNQIGKGDGHESRKCWILCQLSG